MNPVLRNHSTLEQNSHSLKTGVTGIMLNWQIPGPAGSVQVTRRWLGSSAWSTELGEFSDRMNRVILIAFAFPDERQNEITFLSS
jgi:hypothetical protein